MAFVFVVGLVYADEGIMSKKMSESLYDGTPYFSIESVACDHAGAAGIENQVQQGQVQANFLKAQRLWMESSIFDACVEFM